MTRTRAFVDSGSETVTVAPAPRAPGLRLGLLVAVTAALAGGCAANGDEVLLLLAQTVPGEGCVLSGDEEGLVRSSGRLDVLGGTGYLFTPLVKNTASTETGTEAQRTIFIEEARVDLRFPDPELFSDEEEQALADAGVTRFAVPLSGAVSPNGSTLPFGFEILRSTLVAALSDKLGDSDALILVQAEVRMRGEMGGGTVESQLFTYTVEVCAGCLVFDNGPCAMLENGFQSALGNECNPFQDGATDCCSVGEALRCPATRSGT